MSYKVSDGLTMFHKSSSFRAFGFLKCFCNGRSHSLLLAPGGPCPPEGGLAGLAGVAGVAGLGGLQGLQGLNLPGNGTKSKGPVI